MKKGVFNMPKAVTINARSSSITNSFFNGIVPVVKPTEEQIKNALEILEQDANNVCCAYCGDKKTEWDHLYPLIDNKKHTGYITEIANLVPACGKCNQSKGNSNWKVWMLSDAEKSPKSRGILDLDRRIKLIENYDRQFQKQKINLEEIIGKELWEKYMQAYDTIISEMDKAQAMMNEIKKKVKGIEDKQNSCNEAAVENRDSVINNVSLDKPIETSQNLLNSRNNVLKRTVLIKGIEFDLELVNGESIQDFIKRTFRKLYKNDLVWESELSRMQNSDYCQGTFHIDHRPLLQSDPTKLKEKGYDRYWRREKFFGKFYACHEWYNEYNPKQKERAKIQKRKFKEWLEYIADYWNSH